MTTSRMPPGWDHTSGGTTACTCVMIPSKPGFESLLSSSLIQFRCPSIVQQPSPKHFWLTPSLPYRPLPTTNTSFYLSSCHRLSQVADRAARLGVDMGRLPLYLATSSNMVEVLGQVAGLRPAALVLDSIQTVMLPMDSAMGSVKQVRWGGGANWDGKHGVWGGGCSGGVGGME